MRGLRFEARRSDRRRRELRDAAIAGAGAVLVGGALAWGWSRSRSRRGEARGRPGASPLWAPSDKCGVGTSADPASQVWYTLNQGVLTEVFYPRLDRPCVRDLALVVTDGSGYVSDERTDAEHRVEVLAADALSFRLINTGLLGRYRIEKTTLAHPRRSAVVQRVRFTPLRGDLEDYRVFAMLNPHLGLRHGIGGEGWVGRRKGRSILAASRSGAALALDCSTPWRANSVGYVGTPSDGWEDLRRHGRLTHRHDHAGQGNLRLTGEIDLRTCGGEFTIALGLGPDPEEAALQALASLLDDFDAIQAESLRGWRDWQARLIDLGASERGETNLFRTSAAVLRAHGGKVVPGAVVASLSIPWGASRGEDNLGLGGYHMVWARDLVEAAGGFAAVGARDDAKAALTYLRSTQQEDGHWPQNMWVSGEPYWSGIQVGETAMPILLADLLQREGLLGDSELAGFWPMVERAVRYILRNGASSQQDRWENARGFTPFSIAVLIAALLAAADLADRQGEDASARFLRETADAWNDAIEYWTYVKGTELAQQVGVSGYYLRIAPPDQEGEPSKTRRPGVPWSKRLRESHYRPDQVVSPDALAYVRFGLRAADDPRIVETVRVVDALLKVETPFGPCWRRYNHDGYGETADGSPYNGRDGIGRAWPLLTGERAHYELAAGRPDEADRLRQVMARFASEGGMIPEQVWDAEPIPDRNLFPGRPTGSAMPLAWAHAEYLKLLRSLRDGRVFDLPPQTSRRYLVEKVRSPRVIWRDDHRRGTLPAGKILRVELHAPAVVRWKVDGAPDSGAAALHPCLGMHHADLPTDRLAAGARLTLTFDPSTTRPAQLVVV